MIPEPGARRGDGGHCQEALDLQGPHVEMGGGWDCAGCRLRSEFEHVRVWAFEKSFAGICGSYSNPLTPAVLACLPETTPERRHDGLLAWPNIGPTYRRLLEAIDTNVICAAAGIGGRPIFRCPLSGHVFRGVASLADPGSHPCSPGSREWTRRTPASERTPREVIEGRLLGAPGARFSRARVVGEYPRGPENRRPRFSLSQSSRAHTGYVLSSLPPS